MAVVVSAALTIALPSAAAAKRHSHAAVVTELATFAAPGCTGTCGSGSTIGPVPRTSSERMLTRVVHCPARL
jgi:hypothetical protein